jgi:nitronate monooxygenase
MDLQQTLGLELPIIQAPMAGIHGAALAVAVSQAGGLGSLPCAMFGGDAMRQELEAMRAQSGGKPGNVNFFCHQPPRPDEAREAAWRAVLAPYHREFGIDPASIKAGPGRLPFSLEAVALLEQFRPPVVSFHFGLPEPALLQQVRRWGALVFSSATTLEEGLWLQAQGVDAVIAQGLEAGGHRGMFLTEDISTQIGTMALLPQLVRALTIPVIAAGGIADRSGVVAALALGASMVQVGTAFLLCPEAGTSAVHRKALQSEEAGHTALTNLFTGRPARGIVNRIMRELGAISTLAPAFPLAGSALAPLRAAAEAQGSGDFSPLWSGQNATGCKAVPAGQLARELAGV